MTDLRLKNIIALFFLVAVAINFITPIMDPDFPWHLKTGEYIYQHGEIPKTDPFSISSTGRSSEKYILSQYWLAQVIFHLIITKIGAFGIIMLRSLVFTGIIAILWFSMKKTPILLKAGILYYTARLFHAYLGDRPQFFSFLFSAVVVVLLEKYRKTFSARYLIFIPFLMCFWANSHGGFIFGDVVIIIVCLSEAVKYFFIRDKMPSLPEDKLLLLLSAGFISIIVSYLNPNIYQAFIFAYEGSISPYIKVIKEYIPPLVETQGPFASINNFIYWSIMGYSLCLLALNLRKADLTHLGLVFFTLYISLTAVRFVPFFVMTALIISGQYGLDIAKPDKFIKLKRLGLLVHVALLIAVLFWCGSLYKSMPSKRLLTKIVGQRLYPESAVLFLDKNFNGGGIFNSHSTGSYIVLRLYPKFKSFIDTRAYNLEAVLDASDISYARRWDFDRYSLVDTISDLLPTEYGKIEMNLGNRPAHPPGQEKWQQLLDNYKIDIILHEASNYYTGELYPLPLRLIKNKQWKLIFSDGKAMIFVRDIPKYKELISRFELCKEKVYDQIGMENAPRLGSIHSQIYSSLAFALLMKGGSDKLIEEYVKHALYLDPKDMLASYIEAFLKIKRAKK